MEPIFPDAKHFVAENYPELVLSTIDTVIQYIVTLVLLILVFILLKGFYHAIVSQQPDDLRSVMPELDVLLPHNRMEQDPLEGEDEHSEIQLSDDEGYIN